MKWSVYLLRDPNNKQVRYVGCSLNVKTRLQSHGRRGPCKEWLRELKRRGEQPIVEVIATEHPSRASKIEKEAIQKYRSEPQLLNGYPGGRKPGTPPRITKRRLGPRALPKWKRRCHVVGVSFRKSERKTLEERARQRGISMSELIRNVVLEHIGNVDP